ncbi:hypothetical protein DO021_11335 [Desulfobacter hydrogenophilus]|uniref:Uncharacterized protein n=1 Tax=Desulfobacter hydrogenophilus TaxID=2291 RepID=A0A328FCA9_9BACT|nr:hypothetical protein DO021_11335 [Desulfobacter hydrogenophilus]
MGSRPSPCGHLTDTTSTSLQLQEKRLPLNPEPVAAIFWGQIIEYLAPRINRAAAQTRAFVQVLNI